MLLPAFVCHLSTAQFIRASSTSERRVSPGGPTAGARPVAFPLHFTAACHRRSGIFLPPPPSPQIPQRQRTQKSWLLFPAASLTTFAFRGGTPRHGADARQLPKLRASRSRTLAGGARRMMDCAAVSSAALWPRAKQTPAPVADVPRLFPRFLFLRQRIEM